VTDAMTRSDPENRLLSRMPMRRLDAEALRDSLHSVSGTLVEIPGGLPDPVAVDRDGLVSVIPHEGGGWRRSVYLQYRRTAIPTMMDTFDYPQMGPNCISRTVSTVAPQSLMLMNSQHVRRLAGDFARRVESLLSRRGVPTTGADGRRSKVDLVYQLALSRRPSDEERRLGTRTLGELEQGWSGDATKALETYCHTIFNSADFLYVD